MSNPTSSMWRIVTKDGTTNIVDSDTLAWLCRSKDHLPLICSIELLRGQAAEDAREVPRS